MSSITIIGGGLAGCEAAWAAASRGVQVRLVEMKPVRFSPAHKSPLLAELVCSNSLKAKRLESAAGLLKAEMRQMGSLLLQAADLAEVDAGGALAVDRDIFSRVVTEKIRSHPNIQLVSQEAQSIPEGIVLLAAGPLCEGALAEEIRKLTGGFFSFYDAAAPIVAADSVDMKIAFFASRYGRGGDDYINCPMNKEEYTAFYQALIGAEIAPLHGFDKVSPKVYEGCMPVEVMARRGEDTLRFGPLKPVGLTDPRTGRRPWAAVQLRKENAEGSLYNLVGFQTNLKFGEQKRVFSMIPGLENAEFVRYGVMHRNSFIDSPRLLSPDLFLKKDPRIGFAGQISGVEGYMESAASGIVCGINAVRKLRGEKPLVLPRETMIGSLLSYITDPTVEKFQPMGANFGILPPLEEPVRDKSLRYQALAERAMSIMKTLDFQ